MSLLLAVLLAISQAFAGPPTRHKAYNHLAWWTDVDEHTRLDTIGREIALHPRRRADIEQYDADKLMWQTGDPAVTQFLRGYGVNLKLQVGDGDRLELSGRGVLTRYQVPITRLWRIHEGMMVALAESGELFVFEAIETTNGGKLNAASLDLPRLHGSLDGWQIRVNAEKLSAYDDLWVPKVFVLRDSDTTDASFVYCVTWNDDDLQSYAARLRFVDAEARWPVGTESQRADFTRDGVMSQVPPLSVDLPGHQLGSLLGDWKASGFLGGGPLVNLASEISDPLPAIFLGVGAQYEWFQMNATYTPARLDVQFKREQRYPEFNAQFGVIGGIWAGYPVIGATTGISGGEPLHAVLEGQLVYYDGEQSKLGSGGHLSVGQRIYGRLGNRWTPGIYADFVQVEEVRAGGTGTSTDAIVGFMLEVRL